MHGHTILKKNGLRMLAYFVLEMMSGGRKTEVEKIASWAGHLARMEELRKTYRILVVNPIR
jgi:hypothetical protein